MASHENAHGVRDRGRRGTTDRESELSRTHGINDAAGSAAATPSFEAAAEYRRFRLDLIPLRRHDKMPADKHWQERAYDQSEVLERARRDGLNLGVLRTYNSQGQLLGTQGWLFGPSQYVHGLTGTVDTAGSTVTRVDEDGASVLYVYDAVSGAYVSQGNGGGHDTLAWDAGASAWQWTDGATHQQETYDADGKVVALSDPRTGASYAFHYDDGKLSEIVAGASGRGIVTFRRPRSSRETRRRRAPHSRPPT